MAGPKGIDPVQFEPAQVALDIPCADNDDGPCHEAYRTGVPVVANDLASSDVEDRWPTVVERMRDMG